MHFRHHLLLPSRVDNGVRLKRRIEARQERDYDELQLHDGTNVLQLLGSGRATWSHDQIKAWQMVVLAASLD
jgi:hypothetical protein